MHMLLVSQRDVISWLAISFLEFCCLGDRAESVRIRKVSLKNLRMLSICVLDKHLVVVTHVTYLKVFKITLEREPFRYFISCF